MLGERVKKYRERHAWSQQELAKRAKVPQPVISRLESGVQDSMTTDLAKRLARTLGVSVDYLIGTWEDDADEVATASATLRGEIGETNR